MTNLKDYLRDLADAVCMETTGKSLNDQPPKKQEQIKEAVDFILNDIVEHLMGAN